MFLEKVTSNKGRIIKGLIKILPTIHEDQRGSFQVTWNRNEWSEILKKDNNLKRDFVQENQSRSRKGILRGLHYQKEPFAQGKLVRCINGCIYDVAVDLRKRSQTFGEWAGIELSSDNNLQFWIPQGFAHGFLTLSDLADVSYKVNDFWQKDSEKIIIWNDKDININWPLNKIENNAFKLSIKDQKGLMLSELSKEDLF